MIGLAQKELPASPRREAVASSRRSGAAGWRRKFGDTAGTVASAML